MQLLRDNLVSQTRAIDILTYQANESQTLWTSSEAEPSGEAGAAAAPEAGESKDTSDAPIGEDAKPAQ